MLPQGDTQVKVANCSKRSLPFAVKCQGGYNMVRYLPQSISDSVAIASCIAPMKNVFRQITADVKIT